MRCIWGFVALLFAVTTNVQAENAAPTAPVPTYANIAYAPADPVGSKGHLLDLYLPAPTSGTLRPVAIWTGGSAWMADTGKESAGWLVAQLNRAGYAVAGVSIRSSSQVKFPGQLYDIKAAIRWIRLNAVHYGLDGNRIAIIGDSSGGWTAAMAAVTGDVPALEGNICVTGVSSAVQAAIAFYPPSDFTAMDHWTVRPCVPNDPQNGCHDDANSPESLLIGCPIQTCPDKVHLADPARYVSDRDPPILIFHGDSDDSVPHEQGAWLYQALNRSCHDAVFVDLPTADHGPALAFLTDERLSAGATIRSTSSAGCKIAMPKPYHPSFDTIVDFLNTHLKPRG